MAIFSGFSRLVILHLVARQLTVWRFIENPRDE